MVLGDDEKISIQVFEDVARHLAVVTISDSGKGLNQEEIDEINQPFDYDWGYWKNENRGIGLRYVKAMLESFYDGQTRFVCKQQKRVRNQNYDPSSCPGTGRKKRERQRQRGYIGRK